MISIKEVENDECNVDYLSSEIFRMILVIIDLHQMYCILSYIPSSLPRLHTQ